MVPNACSEGIDLLNQLLQYDSTKRPSPAKILEHPYFTRHMVQKAKGWKPTPVRKKQVMKQSNNPVAKNQVFSLQNNNKLAGFDETDDHW